MRRRRHGTPRGDGSRANDGQGWPPRGAALTWLSRLQGCADPMEPRIVSCGDRRIQATMTQQLVATIE